MPKFDINHVIDNMPHDDLTLPEESEFDESELDEDYSDFDDEE